MDTKLYSIGHGHKTLDEFLSELVSFNIKYLIDVRSTPYSKWSPDFNQESLKKFLSINNIVYGYMGDIIGGRPLNNNCYDEEGYFDYKKMADIPTFKEGLKRLVNANNLSDRVAIMCSESDPSLCHRSKLIGRELYYKYNINMIHILTRDKTISEIEIINKLAYKGFVGGLFNDNNNEPPYFKSIKSYKEEHELEEIYD